jgi:uncharacterized membrane protein YjjB (DUF3815 family)
MGHKPFAGTKFPNQSDISSAVGAFAVGFMSNLYGRFFERNAFVVMVNILLPVPPFYPDLSKPNRLQGILF